MKDIFNRLTQTFSQGFLLAVGEQLSQGCCKLVGHVDSSDFASLSLLETPSFVWTLNPYKLMVPVDIPPLQSQKFSKPLSGPECTEKKFTVFIEISETSFEEQLYLLFVHRFYSNSLIPFQFEPLQDSWDRVAKDQLILHSISHCTAHDIPNKANHASG